MAPTRTINVTKAEQCSALLRFLITRFTYQDENQWRAHIASGRVLLNDQLTRSDTALNAGDRVSFTPEPYDEPEVNTAIGILFEDADFVFIDKPPNLPCHPAGIYLYNTLWSILSERFGPLHLVNRLDRETSGIVLAAKTATAAAQAQSEMSAGRFEKSYLVLVEGIFPSGIDAGGYLVKDENSPVRKKLRFVAAESSAPDARFCQTRFTLVANYPDGTALVRAQLLTGKTHQIRATLQSLGYPVVGDKLYGVDSRLFLRLIDGTISAADRALLRMEHQALHCARLKFSGAGGRVYDISAALPASWPVTGR